MIPQDRRNILAIHTKAWDPPLKLQFLAELAEHTGGYCGADLKALCTEAALHALRRCYPQIYTTSDKLVLDISKINIAAADFHYALKRIVPTAQRSDSSVALSLSLLVRPLLIQQLDMLVTTVSFFFPVAWKALFRAQQSIKALMAVQEKGKEAMGRWITGGGDKCAVQVATPPCNGFSQPADSNTPVSAGKGSRGRSRFLSLGSNSSEGHKLLGRDCWEPLPTSHTPLNASDPIHSSVTPNLSGLPFNVCKRNELNRIYFDMNEIAQVDEEGPSILQVTEGSGGSSPTPAQNHQQQGATGEADKHSIKSTPFDISCYLSLSAHPHTIPEVHHPRLLVCGPCGMGQTSHLAPALLHALEDYPVKVIDLPALYGSSSRSPEEACTQVR